MMKIVVVFDLDSTLIQMETIDELARLVGKLDQCSEITRRAMNGEIDFSTSLRLRVALLEGLNSHHAWQVLFKNCKLCDGTKELISSLLNLGCSVIIVSGGFLPMTEHVAHLLGVQEYYANELSVREGVFTGEISTTNTALVDAGFKEEIVKREQAKGNHLIAVGDGANDLLMLKRADLAIASPLAKPIVKQTAHHYVHHLLDILPIILDFSI